MPFNKDFNEAALYGEFEKVKDFVDQEPSLVNQSDEYGFTALHQSAEEGHLEIIQYLIDKGADVNVINEDGTTPLHLVAYQEAVELLLKNGADIEAKNKDGETPLIISIFNQDSEEVIERLLIAGADIHSKNNDGQTALDIAKMREEDEYTLILEEFLKTGKPIDDNTYTDSNQKYSYTTKAMKVDGKKSNPIYGLLLLRFILALWILGFFLLFAISTLGGCIIFILTSPITVALLLFYSNSVRVYNELRGKTKYTNANQFIIGTMVLLVIIAVTLMVYNF